MSETDDFFQRGLRKAVDDAVYLAQRESGRSGSEVVHQALELCRTELVAAVGGPGAVHLLRSLADAIEAEIND